MLILHFKKDFYTEKAPMDPTLAFWGKFLGKAEKIRVCSTTRVLSWTFLPATPPQPWPLLERTQGSC